MNKTQGQTEEILKRKRVTIAIDKNMTRGKLISLLMFCGSVPQSFEGSDLSIAAKQIKGEVSF